MAYDFAHGSGAVNDPYQIWNQADLQGIGQDNSEGQPNYFENHFIQMADIELSGYSGLSVLRKGGYDGNDFSIIFLDKCFITSVEGAYIRNITFVWPEIIKSGIGGIFEQAIVYDGLRPELTGIRVLYGLVSAGHYAGMIAGKLFGAQVSDCFVLLGGAEGGDNVGGMFGYAANDSRQATTIENCILQGVSIGEIKVGGFVGEIKDSSIKKCGVEIFSVIGDSYVGGFVGYSYHSLIDDCYVLSTDKILPTIATVEGDSYVGGFAGMVVEAPPIA